MVRKIKCVGFSSATLGGMMDETGNIYYENCCLKTLNQAIGRGIRHVNDHASIYLLDCRF